LVPFVGVVAAALEARTPVMALRVFGVIVAPPDTGTEVCEVVALRHKEFKKSIRRTREVIVIIRGCIVTLYVKEPLHGTVQGRTTSLNSISRWWTPFTNNVQSVCGQGQAPLRCGGARP
jgi:hypothetical protein